MHSNYPHLNNLFYIERRDSPEAQAYEATPEFKAWRAAIEMVQAVANTHLSPDHPLYKQALEVFHATVSAAQQTPQHKAYEAMLEKHGLTKRQHTATDSAA